MADGISFKLEGMDEVLGRLDSLSHDVKYKGGRYALRKAANLVAAQAKANAERLDDPETGRSIADNVAVRWSTRAFKSAGDLKFRVGVKGGAVTRSGLDEGAGGPTPHWRLLEFGTEKMAARPFMRRALSDNIGPAINEFAKHFGPAIDRAIKRVAKKPAV